MKQIIYLLTVLPLFFLWGCNSDDFESDPMPEAGDKIKFEIGFVPQNDDKPQTRVATAPDFASTWENGDEIGIFAVKRGSSETKALAATGNYMHNVKLTYSTADGGKWTAASDLWHASGGDVLDIYAYYPYDASLTDPTNITFAVKADQSGTDYNKSDLLMAKKENVAKSANAVSLQFAHALSLVQVEFVSGGVGAHVDDFILFSVKYENQTKVTVNATIATKSFSLSDDNIEASTDATTDIVMTRVEGLPNTYRALVPAQAIATGKALFTITRGGKLHYITNTVASLAKAKASKYKVTLVAPTLDANHAYVEGDAYPYRGLAEGIVYAISNAGKNGKIVSLDEANLEWSWQNIVTGANRQDNGMINMRKVLEKVNKPSNIFHNHMPFQFADGLNTQQGIATNDYSNFDAKGIWYVPAFDELKSLYDVYATDKTDFNAKLTAGGGVELKNNYYWSSSENGNSYARIVYFDVGTTSFTFKFNYRYVRAVSAF